MAFDPDAYLAASTFDPDAYLGASKEKPSFGQMMKEQIIGSAPVQLGMGAVRGAGSIGATLLAPYDIAKDAIAGKGLSLESNRERRAAMDEALKGFGADQSGLAYNAGKIGAEIAGTAGIPGVLAKGAQAAKVAPALVEALRTGGLSAGGITGVKGMAARIAGGALTGGATAGLINPEDAGTGAVIGGALPPVVQAAGMAGKALGERGSKRFAEELAKFKRNEPARKTIKESVDAGYVIPPNMVEPSLKNAIIESFSGKQATSQIASVKNQQVTEKLVRESLGLADDAPLTKGALEQIRKIEGGAYKKIADLSDEASQTLEALKQARNDAQGWFNAYNRSASPADLAKAKEFRDMANSLENALEFHATAAGKEELIPALQKARQQIAKTYTVQRALNDASGTVNAKVLGRLYEKGTPLTGGLEQAGRFASAFPSIAQAPQQMGSPAAHNLRSMASLLMAGGGAAAAGPVGLGAAAVPFVTGPASRALMFREGAQKALIGEAPKLSKAAQLAQMLANPEMQQMLMRSSPVIAAQ